MKSIAKVFKNGRSQAVRIPKEFCFKGNDDNIAHQEPQEMINKQTIRSYFETEIRG